MEICSVMTMKKGRMANCDETQLTNKTMKGLTEGCSHKYLGIIQADDMKKHERY